MPVNNQLYDRLGDVWWQEGLAAQPAAHQHVGARNRMRETRDTSLAYAGYALKP